MPNGGVKHRCGTDVELFTLFDYGVISYVLRSLANSTAPSDL